MTLVIIPARYGSSRLPGKPLEKIGRKTVIEHCVDRAKEAGLAPYVATDDRRIADLFPEGTAIRTGDCATGTDRVAQAAEIIDPQGQHEFVVNYQGDMPFLEAETLREFVRQREATSLDVLTAYTTLDYVSSTLMARRQIDCHIGLYGFTRAKLREFAATNQTPDELHERLEQLRIKNNASWMFMLLHYMPMEINTRADLALARQVARCTS